MQEGMIGLYKAIRDFQPEKLSSFRAFAELCITRQIITAIKTATRQKHVPLNSATCRSTSRFTTRNPTARCMDVIAEGRVANPGGHADHRAGRRGASLRDQVGQVLSVAGAARCSTAYLDGKSYQEIAQELDRHVKSIDNALQRVKRKLEKFLAENGGE